MQQNSSEIIIKGLTTAGKTFRPSDWAERLSGCMSAFGSDNRMVYSPFVQPVTIGGIRCVVVKSQLRELQPLAYSFLLEFAKENDLQVEEKK